MTIAAMFPFFKDTVFEDGIDAAFRSTRSHEAYLFRGDKYALVDYDSKNLIAIRNITDGFPSLLGTVFASEIDAAFASHREDEAYLFKGELYALINFAPGTTDDHIVGGNIKHILTNWPSLRSILPLKNKGLDTHDHHGHGQDHDPDQHDEF
ncbi:Albumin-2 protein [Spatholobus suberectus]|nr:Albumin-2 protein [Spatholobus suberectus]